MGNRGGSREKVAQRTASSFATYATHLGGIDSPVHDVNCLQERDIPVVYSWHWSGSLSAPCQQFQGKAINGKALGCLASFLLQFSTVYTVTDSVVSCSVKQKYTANCNDLSHFILIIILESKSNLLQNVNHPYKTYVWQHTL